MGRKGLWITAGVLAAAQLVQPDRTAGQYDPGTDLLTRARPSAEVEHLLRVACYDCHSNTTRYPWYSYVTPVNFWLQHHINDGHTGFNMSAWGSKSAK